MRGDIIVNIVYVTACCMAVMMCDRAPSNNSVIMNTKPSAAFSRQPAQRPGKNGWKDVGHCFLPSLVKGVVDSVTTATPPAPPAPKAPRAPQAPRNPPPPPAPGTPPPPPAPQAPIAPTWVPGKYVETHDCNGYPVKVWESGRYETVSK